MKLDKAGHELHAAFLARAATVVRQRRNIFNALNLQAGRFQGGDRTFATAAWPANLHFHITHAELACLFGSLLRGTLSGEGRTLAAALKSAGASTGPTERIALGIGDCDRGVVERRYNVGNANSHVALDAFA